MMKEGNVRDLARREVMQDEFLGRYKHLAGNPEVDHTVGRKAVHMQVAVAVPTGFAVRKVVEEVAVRMAATSGAGSTGLAVPVPTAETVGTATADMETGTEGMGTEGVGLAGVVEEVCYTPTVLGDTVKMRRSLGEEEVV